MNKPDAASIQRMDQFVDAAFAFAVTLLLIAVADPPATLGELREALLHIPSSALAFFLIALFWTHHRAFGRLTPSRDAACTGLSLAIVFTVLVYVFPLRLLTQSLVYWASGGRLPGEGLIGSWGDLATLYQIYGLGFAALSALYALLFARSVKLTPAPALRQAAVRYRDAWAICAGAGVISALVAILPVGRTPWLPPTMYWLIPIAIYGRAYLRDRKRPASAPAKPARRGGSAPSPRR